MYPEELTWTVDAALRAEHQLSAAFAHAAAAELADGLRMIEHCVGQLDEDQVWWRPAPELNAVGNLLLHLAGNLRQWGICGLRGDVDGRRRPDEFAARGGIAKAELLGKLREVVDEVRDRVLPAVNGDELLRVRTVQGFQVSGMAAIWHTVAHFRGHTQEIIGLTRQILGSRYRFAWGPRTREEGA